MYDIASYLSFLPLKSSREGLGDRFSNAGFDFKSFILNSSDIIFLFLITLANFMLFKLLKYPLQYSKKGKNFVEKKISLFKAGNFIELFLASFLILYLCASLNAMHASFENPIEIA